MASSLTGVWSAAEGTGAVTTGSRTPAAGSLITAICGVYTNPAASESNSVPTSSLGAGVTFTEQFDVSQVVGAGDAFAISCAYNIGGTRGSSMTVSKADDGGANVLGAQEWAGVEASPTIASATATGTNATPTQSVAVSAASLAIGVWGYNGTSATIGTSGSSVQAQEVDENADFQAVCAYYKITQTGTPSVAVALSGSRAWAGGIVCFTEDAGASTTRGTPFDNQGTAFNGGRTFIGPLN